MSKSIAQIKEEFGKADEKEREALYSMYDADARSGVQKLIASYRKKEEALRLERERLSLMKSYERKYKDAEMICGIDEAGRGPLAGPVVAGAVILPKDCEILYLNDSKKLSASRREALYDEIMEKAVAVGVGMASPARIDEINILQATYEAMRKAVEQLSVVPDLLLNDAVTIPEMPYRQVPIVKGDAKSVSIAAGGFSQQPEKLISGGPMMGFAMVSAEAPVTKTSSSILAFKEDIVSKSVETACINCARCVDVCPSRIIPSRLADLAQRHDEKAFVAMNGLECVECGSCSYVCPAKRPLKQAIGSMRKIALANKRKK